MHHKLPGKEKLLKNLPHIDKNVQAMCFPILYPNANPGWSIDLKSQTGKKVTLNEYIRFRLFHRDDQIFVPHFYSDKLFQQWLVDSYVIVESLRLEFIQKKQKKLHACMYRYA